MNCLIFLALLCALSLQQTVILSSNVDNTIVSVPTGYNTVIEAHHTQNNPNYIGYSAQWIYKNGGDSWPVWPVGDTTTFSTSFYSDCQSNATLIITADNSFSASLNGGASMNGNSWYKIYKFDLCSLKCGANVLTITVVNQDDSSPAALIFAVTQDQSKCYNCLSPLSFYNRSSCQCECINSCGCDWINSVYKWSGYPVCGCKCNNNPICSTNQYFNAYKCACQCKPIACLPLYAQNTTTCLCQKKCPKVITCPSNQVWDDTLCQCVCQKVLACPSCHVWNNKFCQCNCPKILTCPSCHVWDETTCQCVCPKILTCSPPLYWNSDECACTKK